MDPFRNITSNYDLTISVVLNMDFDTLTSYMTSTPQLLRMYNDPEFWKRMIFRRFNTDPETNNPRKEYFDRLRYPVGWTISFIKIMKKTPVFKNELVIRRYEKQDRFEKITIDDLKRYLSIDGSYFSDDGDEIKTYHYEYDGRYHQIAETLIIFDCLKTPETKYLYENHASRTKG